MINFTENQVKIPRKYNMCCKVKFCIWYQTNHPVKKETETLL